MSRSLFGWDTLAASASNASSWSYDASSADGGMPGSVQLIATTVGDATAEGIKTDRDGVVALGAVVDAGTPVEMLLLPEPMLAPPTDSLYSSQWNLTAINVLPVWDDYTGAGIVVSVYDTGIDWTHPDLDSRVIVGINTTTGGGGGFPIETDDNHGTAVAGLIAAERNGTGVVGVAYDSLLVSLYQGFSAANPGNNVVAFDNARVYSDVMNNSWGYTVPFADDFSGGFATDAFYLRQAAEYGRGGLGTVIVFSAGNDRTDGGNSNYHNFQNDRHVVTVAASNQDGSITSYSTPGASILVTAPGSPLSATIPTTDRVGSPGYNNNGTNFALFNGTSAAAPQISGVVALMLDANPNLGYRDVQEILAYSARQTTTSGYEYNGARNWNGGGLHFSEDFGAGLVDARAAVRLAEFWGTQRSAHNELAIGLSAAPNAFISDNTTIASTLTYGGGPIDIDFVEVDVVIEHTYRGDLSLELVSPSGVVSTLKNAAGLDGVDNLVWKFSSTHYWGENGVGNWTLRVRDNAGGDVGFLRSWSLRLYFDPQSANDTYYYTDEFNEIFSRNPAQATQRATLNDTDGGTDLFNGAALSGNATIRLDGVSSTIDGRALTITNNVIENAYGGDGNDSLIGNAANNVLYAARGNDMLDGADGADLIAGAQGNDTLYGGSGNDELWGGDGNDSFYGGANFDVLRGGAGNDLYRIDSSIDVVDETSAGSSGTDTILIATIDAFQTPIGIEAAIYEGGAIFTVGLSTAEILQGAATNDRIDGAGGNDTVRGLDGNDAVIGGAGDDRLEGGTGADRMYGGLGNDVYVVDNAGDSVVESSLEALWGQDSTTGAIVSWSAGVNGLGTQVGSSRPDVGWALAGRGDFNNDGTTDSLFRNLVTGENLVWYLNASGGFIGQANLSVPVVDTSWRIAGVGDFDGDERPDILWRNLGSGLESLWTMSGITLASAVLLPISVGSDWDIAGTADFNADGKMDILWRNAAAGLTSLWLMDGATPISTTLLSVDAAAGWQIAVVGDFTGDNKADIEWRNGTQSTLWQLDGSTVLSQGGQAWALPASNFTNVFAEAAGGVDRVESSITYTISRGIEQLTLTGTSAINGTGNAGNNLITGNSAINSLFGGGGMDTLSGGDANDQLFGGADSDLLQGELDADRLFGDGGGDTLYGSSGADSLFGGEGNDRLFGGDGADVDSLAGGAGDDTMYGGTGVDSLGGGSGADTFDGGAGADLFNGDGGGDVFVVDGTDTVTETAAGAEILYAQNMVTGEVASFDISGGSLGTQTAISRPGSGWLFEGRGDFNGDNRADHLFRNADTGENLVWFLDSAGTRIGAEKLSIPTVDPSWQVAGVGDFNGDGLADILWRNQEAGLTILWEMKGVTAATQTSLSIPVGPEWQIAGVGDFTGDGKADILWRHPTGGFTSVWTMNGATPTATPLTSHNAPVGWEVGAVGDFTGDGLADILWRDGASNTVWQMNGATRTAVTSPAGLPGTDWVVSAADLARDRVDAPSTYSLGTAVEDLTLTGGTAINGTGNGDGNIITGNSAVNTLNGGAGRDQIRGGGGNDTLTGGTGRDVYFYTSGDGSDRFTDVTADELVVVSGGILTATGFGTSVLTLQGGSTFTTTNGYLWQADDITFFAQDLDGDGTTDFKSLLEVSGTTTLAAGAGRYFLHNSSGTGPSLKYSGADVIAGQYSGWAPIGTEVRAGIGYDVAWKVAGADQYTVWRTDSSGNYTSSLTDVVAGGSYALQSLEASFSQDLNGDGTTGLISSVIESSGTTTLTATADRYAFSGAPGGTLKYLGADVIAGQFGAWAPIGMEAVAGGGYDVVWKATGADEYTAWHVDSGGNYVSSPLGVVSGNDSAIKVLETLFSQNLNGVAPTGVTLTQIEALGPTALRTGEGRYFIDNSGAPDATVKYLGADVIVGQFGAWAPIGVEAAAGGGYDVVWKATGADEYTAWHVDGSGNYVSSLIGVVPGADSAIKVLETLLSQNLNGDGATGVALIQIEAQGSTALRTGEDRYFIDNSGAPDATVKYLGADVIAGQFGAWAPIGVEAAGGGYDVVWKATGADEFTAWHTDGSGNYASSLLGVVSANAPELVALETRFNQDLNGSGFIG